MMFFLMCGHADKESGKKGKDVCLKEGYEQLDAVHKKDKAN